MNRNESLFNRAKALIPGGVNSPVRAFGSVGGVPRFIKKAEGAYVWDENDRFIPMGRLLNQTGKAVAFKYNEESRLVREIWILTDAEADRFIEHAKKQKKAEE